ncbi:MAG: hypothetical protein LBG80_19995 [Bacteroidales bacterium]|jgi:hypothetical protein|nr:hypothetical protein [Bacteroidales bacterium]
MVIFKHNGILAMEGKSLWEEGIVSYENYKQYVRREKITVLQRGCRNRSSIISYETLPAMIKEKVDKKLRQDGELSGTRPSEAVTFFEQYIKSDASALTYYRRLEESHKISGEKVREYYMNAIVLNGVHELMTRRSADRKARNKTGRKVNGLFVSVMEDLKRLSREKYPHSLPLSVRNFRTIYKSYISEEGRNYGSLVHKNTGNQHARLVDEKIEQLILSLSIRGNNPYSKWVYEDYRDFIEGRFDLIDEKTGEVYDREIFRKGKKYITLSETTVSNYLNKAENRIIIDKVRMNYHKYRHLVRPHVERSKPRYSLSKVSMDDRDLPRLLENGGHVYAYYAFDVMSGAIVGVSYGLSKNTKLFIECLRNMYERLEGYGVGWPLEAEVENQLTRQFCETLLSPGKLFSYVRYCIATNSQEKYAESMIRSKKYGIEKRRQKDVGRHYNKLIVNQTNGERYYNEESDLYEYKIKRYSYEEIVSEDLRTIEEFNKQEVDGKKTRMEIFLTNLNPEAKMDRRNIALWLGEKEKTTIRRNQYINLHYTKYWLPEVEVLELLKPNDYEVYASYYSSESESAYLYQGNKYICEVKRMEKFVNSQAEWTEKDASSMEAQSKYMSHYDKRVKEQVSLLGNIIKQEKTETISKIEGEDISQYIVKETTKKQNEYEDIEQLISEYDSEEQRARAVMAS